MKKILLLAMAVSAMFSAMSAYAVEDNDEVVLDTQSGSFMLFGDVEEKELYSYSNYAESIESAGASVDIVTRKDIAHQGTPQLSELLNQSGSVYVQTNSSDGSVSSVRMRGTDRVRMTIDGVRADRTSTTSPGIEPQFILSDDIERVEVIKGPQGNVAGTNASGGLIALQTRRGKGPLSIEMGSEMGNLGTVKERFAVMGGDHSLDYYMGVTWFKTDGGAKVDGLGKIKNDDYNNLSVVANIGKRVLDERAEVRNIFRFSRARKNLGVGYQQAAPYGLYQAPNNYALNYDIMNVTSFTHNPTDKYNYDAKFSIYHNENNSYTMPDDLSGDPVYESISKINSTRLNAQTQHNYKLFDWNTLSVGYNLETEFIDGNSKDVGMWTGTVLNGYSGNTIQNDIFVNDSINIKDKLFIRGGARLIHNSDFGTYVTPNASATLVLPTFKLEGAKTKFRGSWGQSVNNPTLYQRFGTVNSSYMKSLANPNLDAEKMESWDVGVTQSFFEDKLSFDLGYFNSNYKDYISYHGTTDPVTWFYTGQYVNIDSAKIQGAEAKVTWEPTTWIKAIASYTYTDSEDKATGHALSGVPKNSLKGTVYWTPNDIVNLFAGIEANEGRYMSSAIGAEKTGSYVDMKLGGKVRLLKTENTEVSLTGTVYNLLDQDVSMYKTNGVSYYAPGIHFRAGLAMKYTLPERDKKKKETENLWYS